MSCTFGDLLWKWRLTFQMFFCEMLFWALKYTYDVQIVDVIKECMVLRCHPFPTCSFLLSNFSSCLEQVVQATNCWHLSVSCVSLLCISKFRHTNLLYNLDHIFISDSFPLRHPLSIFQHITCCKKTFIFNSTITSLHIITMYLS